MRKILFFLVPLLVFIFLSAWTWTPVTKSPTQEASSTQKTLGRIVVTISAESIPYCDQVKVIKLDILNNYQTVSLTIDSKKISLQDSEKTLLRILNSKQVGEILDAIANKFDTQASKDNQLREYEIAQQAQAEQQAKKQQKAEAQLGDILNTPKELRWANQSSEQTDQANNCAEKAMALGFIAHQELEKKQEVLSYRSNLSGNSLDELVMLSPQTRIKTRCYFSVVDTKPPYRLSIVIKNKVFIFNIDD